MLEVGSYSVGLGLFVAGGVGCGRDDCWGFLWVSVRGLLSPPFFLWRVCLCVTVGLGCCGSWRVSAGAGGLWRFFWGVLWGFYVSVVMA